MKPLKVVKNATLKKKNAISKVSLEEIVVSKIYLYLAINTKKYPFIS